MNIISDSMAENFVLRPATIADAVHVTACVYRAFEHYVERIGRPPGPMLEDYEQVIQKRQVFVVETNKGLAGVIVLAITGEGFLLDVIAVDPVYQNKGVGKLLLTFAEEEARRQGFASIYLYTHIKMIENQELYSKIGYLEYDRRNEHGLERVFMRKLL
jgi:GNAT superfamily N-acetyltransferase